MKEFVDFCLIKISQVSQFIKMICNIFIVFMDKFDGKELVV
jgi:hypothetical protein